MTIVKWKLIVLLEKHKKVTLAAKELGLKQPTVTFHMKKMEEEWATQLFHTKAGRILLTDAGRILYRFALQMLQLHEEAQLEMRLRGAAIKRLRIKIDAPCREEATVLASMLLQPFGYALEFTDGSFKAVDSDHDEPDLIIREALTPSPSEKEHYWKAELKLAVSAALPPYSTASAQELIDIGAGWIAAQSGTLLRRQSLVWAASRETMLRESYSVADTGSARTMAEQGLGFAFVPEFDIMESQNASAFSLSLPGDRTLRLLPLPSSLAYGLRLTPGIRLRELDSALFDRLFGNS